MSAPLAGERIRAIRQLVGISQVDLARAAHVSQPLISQIENGAREASREVLELIAEATATPLSFFYIVPPDIPLGTLRFRKMCGAKAGDTKRVKVLFDEAYRVLTDLLSEVNYPRPDLPVALAEPSPQDIEKIATATREALQLSDDGPIRHITRACERAGVAVVPLTLPSVGDDEEEAVGHFGVSCWLSKDEPAVIGYFSGGPGDRQRYTIAHELGHLVLHSKRRAVRDPEQEANYFAGALLVPEHRAREMFADDVTLGSLQQMKASWGVSIQALIMRGANLGLIDDKRKLSLFKQISSRGWRKNEPVTVHPEEPLLAWKLLTRKFGAPLQYSRAVDELGLGAVVLRSLIPKPSTAS
ncbi:MAG: helix-turn-helix domain-containing protein [Pseudonocardiaceae bacterium]